VLSQYLQDLLQSLQQTFVLFFLSPLTYFPFLAGNPKCFHTSLVEPSSGNKESVTLYETSSTTSTKLACVVAILIFTDVPAQSPIVIVSSKDCNIDICVLS